MSHPYMTNWNLGSRGYYTDGLRDSRIGVGISQMEFTFEPVENRRIYTQVVGQIRQLIESGKLRPGDRLPPERVLAEQFKTSRPSIREALAVLEMIGLTESKTGVGSVVREQTTHASEAPINFEDHSPLEMLEARLVFEPEMARLAAERHTASDLEAMSHCCERMQAAMANHDYEAYNQVDADFHNAIAEATHNTVLYEVGRNVRAGMKERLWRALKVKCLENDEIIRRYTKEHEDLLGRIRSGDVEAAAGIVRTHVKSVETDLF